jgi:hypothetical protein
MLSDLTDPTAVLKAIDESNSLGREKFLDNYGFRHSRDYFVEYGDRRYDSKAVIGAAHGFQHPQLGPLGAHDFSGGKKTVQRRLEALGFTVVVTKRE